MRSGKLLVTSMVVAMLSASGSFAQSSGSAVDALTRTQIIIEAPKIAVRQAVQDLIEELTAAGFTYIEIYRTFLGRAQIIAYSATEIREVIINPTTGEVLRDLAQQNIESLPEQPDADVTSENGNKGGNGNRNGNGNGNGNNNGNNGNAGGGNRN